jgi:hypothetical protein
MSPHLRIKKSPYHAASVPVRTEGCPPLPILDYRSSPISSMLLADSAIRAADLYRVKVPSNRANDRITGLILGRNGRLPPGFPALTAVSPVLCGDIVGSTVDRDLQSGRGRFEPFDDSGRRGATARVSPYAVSP